MSEFDKESGWYSGGEEGWYNPVPEAPKVPAVPVPQPKRRRTGIIVGISCIAAVVILSLLVIFVILPLRDLTEGPLPTIEKPGFAQRDDGAYGEDEDEFSDFRDFFSNYYTTTTGVPSGSRIERYENAELRLSLTSCEGREMLTYGEIYDKCVESIVGIMAFEDGKDGYGWGTGIVMSTDGYILTNEHVIDNSDEAYVITGDGKRYPAKVVGEDSRADIAVLKIEAMGLKPAEFGISDELKVGDSVVAIGNPLGDELTGTMTNGIVSAVNRNVLTNDGVTMNLIQTNTAINEGNSGGPLINMYGQVVGITNMKMAADYFSVTIEGIGFAIPTSSAVNDIATLVENGSIQRPGIGITVGAIPQSAMDKYGLPEGLYISVVDEKSDAYAKGIREGDVLTAVNGQHVVVIDDVSAIKDKLKVGDSLVLTIYRDGKTTDITVVLYDMNKPG